MVSSLLLSFCLFLRPALADPSANTVLPKVIYHVGQKTVLQEDAKAGNIPPDAWSRFIMGSDTRFGLTSWRRGLYGGTNFDNLELYGNQYFGTSNVPWMMSITLKDKCRSPNSFTDINSDPRYPKWIIAHVNEIMASDIQCLNPEASDCGDLLTGQNPLARGAKENICDGLLSRYLSDINAKVVKDELWGEAWYIRDRDCIESIDASPETILGVLAKEKWDMATRIDNDNGESGAFAGTSFALLLGVLADNPKADPGKLNSILTHSRKSDISITFSPNDSDDYWVKKVIPQVVTAFRECTKNGRYQDFQSIARKFEIEVQDKSAHLSRKLLEYVKSTANEMTRTCSK